ncbi:flagellar M-ring protein FliF [Sedimentibacter sp. zth1]|uniref:flagellar basal-body MS-ring/collar protein FliF n=1 Tax=Sedimentibacter sp. zth1 TaxID=2816908 RepID=UPI001A912176|nr:flagellar basal-body MS-ring/collar protein FliF [Sedimentibacter sp. zth1]QSX07202.1 flagellar M-ring protein FliF [Sedimentibacter sp. zth1]
MEEQLKNSGKNIIEFVKKLSKKVKIIIISATSVLIIGAIILTIIMNKTNYVVLFSDLEDEEVTEVMAKLKDKNVEYKYEKSGQILIPEKNESLVRMQLSEEGYPHSGLNYDIFTKNIDFMTTDYEKRKYDLYQLQERISASIETIKGVKEAIVNIAIPENDNYAWDTNKDESSANVKINMFSGYALTKSQVSGIQNLIKTSIVGLKTENISITDTDGNDLTTSNELMQTDTLKLKLEIEREIQNEVESNIAKLLTKGYGKDNVEVSAKCNINLDKKISENLQYIPN